MGRGHAYSYPHFMLIDEEVLLGLENGLEHDMADIGWNNFIDEASSIFMLHETDKRPDGRESYYLGESEFYYVGIDYSGGMSCIFVDYVYQDDEREEFETDYEDLDFDAHRDGLDLFIAKSFDLLINAYTTGAFRRPTSAWTSEAISSY